MRNLPLPSPQSLRDFGFFWAIDALRAFGQPVSFSLSRSSMKPPTLWIVNRPSKKSAVSGGLPAVGSAVSRTLPLRASTSEPNGMPWLALSGTNVREPGTRTRTVPAAGATTTLCADGVGSGGGVAIGDGVGVGCAACGAVTLNARRVSVALPAASTERTTNA